MKKYKVNIKLVFDGEVTDLREDKSLKKESWLKEN